ncbi:MAG: hypothetical protein M3Q27_13195 [Actinomycetota bacterium]|nr:hypothetical protein [Actinomycetota bacterium]
MTAPPRRADGRRASSVSRVALALAAGTACAAAPVVLAPAAAAGVVAPVAGAETTPTTVLRLHDPRLVESSGLVASRLHPGVLWTHNDGDDGRLYAVDRAGQTTAVYRLRGVDARDWGAIAYHRAESGRTHLYVGDIGDNSGTRSNGILVHVLDEPAELTGGTLTAASYRLHYPDTPLDAEALLVHPRTGRLAVVTKGILGGAVYSAPPRLTQERPNVLERAAGAPALVTDGAYVDAERYALRDYGAVHVVRASDGEVVDSLDLPRQRQGESLAVTADRHSLLVGSEGRRSRVWQVPLPGAPASFRARASATPSPEDDDELRPREPRQIPPRRVLAILILAAVGAFLAWRRRR